jgi:hypothetical protein
MLVWAKVPVIVPLLVGFMPSSFLVKTIQVDVDSRTWPTPDDVPLSLRRSSGTTPVDLGQAFHMLGTLTMPSSLSPASPTLFWAWLRYYLAPTTSADLRITMDFADLDPHQKGILSDDFGVAIATQWLVDQFGGVRKIVDGRRFALQFERLLRRKSRSKAKVGTSKLPDFVLQDLGGKWHVLECKGTQSSRDYQRKSLKVAIAQKRAIQLVGSLKGEQLAAALYIANEEEQVRTHLKVIDPEDTPLIRLTENQAEEIEANAYRLTVARALGTIGLNEIATELSLPPHISAESELLRPSEMLRVRSSREARLARASEQARERRLTSFTHGDRRYEGREVLFELPPTAVSLPFRNVLIRQGVAPDVIEEVAAADALADDRMDQRLRPYAETDARIILDSDGNHMALSYGDVLFSEMIWN